MEVSELSDNIEKGFISIKNKLVELELRLIKIELRTFDPEDLKFDCDFILDHESAFTKDEWDKIKV